MVAPGKRSHRRRHCCCRKRGNSVTHTKHKTQGKLILSKKIESSREKKYTYAKGVRTKFFDPRKIQVQPQNSTQFNSRLSFVFADRHDFFFGWNFEFPKRIEFVRQHQSRLFFPSFSQLSSSQGAALNKRKTEHTLGP